MNFDDFQRLYEEMISLMSKDTEITHIDVSFHIKPVKSEKKIARIKLKTYKDENRTNHKH